MGTFAGTSDHADRDKPSRDAQPRAEPAAHDHAPAHGQVIALQQGAGNQAVTRLLQRTPNLDPRQLLEAHPELDDIAARGKTRKAAPEHSERSDATSWDSQPEALQEVLKRSWDEAAFSRFSAMADRDRSYLVRVYNRMVAQGLWGHVKRFTGFKTGEKPVDLGVILVRVPGEAQSVEFEVYNGTALVDTMTRSGKFGKDEGAAGALHAGQTSMREWTTTTSDGLHLSIGAGDDADAHMDQVSPTNRPLRQVTEMDWVRSVEHHWTEVWPQFLRVAPEFVLRIPQYIYDWLVDKTKHLGAGEGFRDALKSIPRSLFDAAAHALGILDPVWAGTTIKLNELEHVDPTQREQDLFMVILKEYRFGEGGREARTPAVAPPAQSSLRARVSAAVSRAIEEVDPGVIKPSAAGGDQGDYADGVTVGRAIAGKILYQAKAGGQTITIDLGPLYHGLSRPEVAEVKEQLARIAKAAREALSAALAEIGEEDLAQAVLGVKSGTVQLGPSPVWFALH